MKKTLLPFLAISLAALASGCNSQEIETPNGILPSGYLHFASPFLGTYSASNDSLFSPVRGTVQLALDGNRPVLSSTMDVLDPVCHSTIGQLQSVEIFTDSDGSTGSLEAKFAFDPGTCHIAGRSVTFHFNKSLFGGDVFQVSVLISHGMASSHPGGGTSAKIKTWDLQKIN